MSFSGQTIRGIPKIAKAIKRSERTTRRMLAEGVLPAYKLRGQWEVREVTLSSFYDELNDAALRRAFSGGHGR